MSIGYAICFKSCVSGRPSYESYIIKRDESNHEPHLMQTLRKSESFPPGPHMNSWCAEGVDLYSTVTFGFNEMLTVHGVETTSLNCGHQAAYCSSLR
jgi:hypothetical protein